MSDPNQPIDLPIRIAMWSGPRNISTAMMRSFGSRPDCGVVDEPFYAAFLSLTGLDHPMRQEILSDQEVDWKIVAEDLSRGPAPGSAPLFYQKHMTHHMVPEIGRDWMASCRHAFLIRHPASVLASYRRKRETVNAEALGYQAQLELYYQACDLTGGAVPVVDTDALLANPSAVLDNLCQNLGIDFDDSMLSWPEGTRDTDGIWSRHWYNAVDQTNGFQAPSPRPELDDREALDIFRQTVPAYEKLLETSIKASD